jgi:hypothetical protein
MSDQEAIPTKVRELQNYHFDLTIWNDFQFRENDIIIATYAKSVTTWVQQSGCCIDPLTTDECTEYEVRAISELGQECADWLKNGKSDHN